MDKRRRFNGHERIAFYLAQDGHCAVCGDELVPSWHADHVKPWSHGGATDVINGQALCMACNLRKGDKELTMELREWQKQAKRQYFADGKRDWLLYVTPGGGKTIWASDVSHDLLQANVGERVVIVVPTDNIRVQWTKQKIIDLAIVTNIDGGRENRSDFQGCVVTYQQVASMPDLYLLGCNRFRTIVIFDEAHHAGDSQTWGKAIKQAFAPAVRRISMTGTPWRAPHRGEIPFVTYDSTGEVQPDFRFSYREAVQHGVCRPIQFHAFDGEVTYVNIDTCSPQQEVMRLGEVEDDNSPVLRDILRADGAWMRSILGVASRALNDYRQGENGIGVISDAKGAVYVHDRAEARAVTKLLSRIAGERPALVISDPEDGEPNPQEELERFRKNQQKWVVAVDMMSEGVDIPSLYVGVYATRKKTPLRFQQIVGRHVRQRPGDECAAVIFLPAVPSLLKLASEIETALLHVMDEETEETQPRESGTRLEHEPEFLVHDTSEARFDRIISGGTSYSEQEVHRAAATCEEFNIPARYAVDMAKVLRAYGLHSEPNIPLPQVQAPPEEITRQEEWRMLRGLLDKKIGSVAGLFATQNGMDIGEAKKRINALVQKRYGNRKDMSIEKLRDAIQEMKALAEKMSMEAEA